MPALTPDAGRPVAVVGPHARAVQGPRPQARRGRRRDRTTSPTTVGQTRRRPAGACCWSACSTGAEPGQVIALVSLADGADVLLFRTTDADRGACTDRTVAQQVAQRRRGLLRQVPLVAGHAHRRAAPPPRAGPHVVVGRGPRRRLEVRLRRFARPRVGRGPPAARAHLGQAARSTTWSRCRWPTCSARSSPSPSTAWPTRRARPWCSPWSTSTAAAGCRSSSPTSTPTTSRSVAASR